MLDFIQDNDLLLLYGSITLMASLAIIIIELINFIPDLMVNILNRMRNKSLSYEADSLTLSEFDSSLDAKLETTLDKDKSLNENDLFKRFGKKK